MHRPLSNPRVRRRLFEPDELTDQAKIDNFTNILQESITRDRIEKSQKWNFDFVKEVPLEGTYEWYPCNDVNNTADWIGVKSENDDGDENSCLSMRIQNEATPKTKTDETLPTLRKRKIDIDVTPETTARRRISFD
ncbi:unnamed protein product [Euphydryas editha]|uniref:Cyclin-dependent kinase inhibitor domain-containing protein n=1 Tax=Euphydryas editha TaxID=104508 RepID=A0AAU9TQM2_EUPED|nr:unnamed protein product [Euphydryas editha]